MTHGVVCHFENFKKLFITISNHIDQFNKISKFQTKKKKGFFSLFREKEGNW